MIHVRPSGNEAFEAKMGYGCPPELISFISPPSEHIQTVWANLYCLSSMVS